MDTAVDPRQAMDALLNAFCEAFNSDPYLNDQLRNSRGWTDAEFGLCIGEGEFARRLLIESGQVSVVEGLPLTATSALLRFATAADLSAYLAADHDDVCRLILSGRVQLEGNQAIHGYVAYLMSLLETDQEQVASGSDTPPLTTEERDAPSESVCRPASDTRQHGLQKPDRDIRRNRLPAALPEGLGDPGVAWLVDRQLRSFTLDDFPRLARFKAEHHAAVPEICGELGSLLTDFHLENGFEIQPDGRPWDPNLRQASAFRYVMQHRAALIRDGDLLAGTMTPNPICGSVTHPATVGWSIWGELRTIATRALDPFDINEETIETLHRHVFPYWIDRHLHQRWIDQHDYPRSALISDRLFCFNLWGLVSLNPGCPGFETVLRRGLNGLREDIHVALSAPDRTEQQTNTLQAMLIALDGVSAYTANLAAVARAQAAALPDPQRRGELEQIVEGLARVPDEPARNLHEAVQAIWLMFIAVGLESTDDDIALGRLDQLLQSYFDADMRALEDELSRRRYLKRSIELVGCLFMRITSHRIGAATITCWQNSGAPATSTVVVGGVKPDGSDAVNDMTYLILKVAEMLSLNDPNMHARFMPGVNSDAYLQRLCEVNYITCGTPALHNDSAVITALSRQESWKIEHIRDWTPTGCVEPVLPGRHLACTGELDSNLMAPLTMALHNGYHPTARWQLGPETGNVKDFETFDEFFDAFRRQFEFIYAEGLTGAKQLLGVHQQFLPCPLFSSMLKGCIDTATDMSRGGALYNSSGASLIALADVVDSLMVIEKLVFEQGWITFESLTQAVATNFLGRESLLAEIARRVPRFGSAHPEAQMMAKRVTRMVADFLHDKDNGRGGNYLTGYRSNNNHTVYGMASGASPSGRRAGKPFTPGLTPHPKASSNILDNMLDVARLDPVTLDNNIAFNVRLAFSPHSSHDARVREIADLVRAYFAQGGMQIQFIMVDRDTLIDAMEHPELYPDLIVRVSGYTGYFVEMQHDLQLEIVARSEFAV
jgi:formate C-acetyltransferase